MRTHFFRGFLFFWIAIASSSLARSQSAVPATPANPDLDRAVQSAKPQKSSAPPAAAIAPTASSDTLTILADSSLRNVLQELAQGWADAQPDGPQVPLTLTNAATMRARIEADPHWDVVIGADAVDMKLLTDRGLLAADGQHTLARNLVMIYGRKALVKDDDLDWFDLVGTEWKKIALGNPETVESGRVALHALQKHDLADEDHKKDLVEAGTEALALHVVQRDQADAVFAYRSDLLGFQVPGFQVYRLDSADAPPVFYLAAVGRLSTNADQARSFIAYCSSEMARNIWAHYGFEMD